MTTDASRPHTPRPRRRHAAAGARVVVGSLSAAAALGLMAVMADAVTPASTASAPSSNPITANAPAVVVVRRPDGLPGTVSPPAVVTAPRVSATAAAPVTKSRGS